MGSFSSGFVAQHGADAEDADSRQERDGHDDQLEAEIQLPDDYERQHGQHKKLKQDANCVSHTCPTNLSVMISDSVA